MKTLSFLAAAALLLSGTLAWSQDEPNLEALEPEPVLIDDLSPEMKARAEAEAREREAEAENAALLAVPDSLESALAAALRNNPDILLADAKVRQAEAELNQVRLKTVQDVLVAYKEYELQKEIVTRVEAFGDTGAISLEEALQRRQSLVRIEAQLRYLLGTPPQGMARPGAGMFGTPGGAMDPRTVAVPDGGAVTLGGSEPMAANRSSRPRLSDDLEHALSAEVDCQFVEMPLRDIMELLRDEIGMVVTYSGDLYSDETGTEVHSGGFGSSPTIVTLNLGRTSWKNVLTALNDKYHLAFIVRDYGLFVARAHYAGRTPGAAIPETLPYRPE